MEGKIIRESKFIRETPPRKFRTFLQKIVQNIFSSEYVTPGENTSKLDKILQRLLSFWWGWGGRDSEG
jgi:hypothetical protein